MSLYLGNTQLTGVVTGALAVDNNLAASNIKNGVEIFGVTGTYVAPSGALFLNDGSIVNINNVDVTETTVTATDFFNTEINAANASWAEQLAAVNAQLAEANAQIAAVNAQLEEANASWAGNLTISGTYASSSYYTASGCSLAVDKQNG